MGWWGSRRTPTSMSTPPLTLCNPPPPIVTWYAFTMCVLVHHLHIRRGGGDQLRHLQRCPPPPPSSAPRCGTWGTPPQLGKATRARVLRPGRSAARAIVRCVPCEILVFAYIYDKFVPTKLWRKCQNSDDSVEFVRDSYEIRAYKFVGQVSAFRSFCGIRTKFVRISYEFVPICRKCTNGRCIGAPSSLSATPNTLPLSLGGISRVVPAWVD